MVLSWGIIGCDEVAERKGGPALYTAEGSELVAVMRRDEAKAADFARRHGAQRCHIPPATESTKWGFFAIS